MQAPFEIEVETVGGVTVVAVTGEIDLEEADVLEAALSAPATPVVVDLGAVDFLGSKGLHALMLGRERARQRQDRFVLVVPPGSAVERLLEMIGGSLIFTACPELAAAIGAAENQDRRVLPDRRGD